MENERSLTKAEKITTNIILFLSAATIIIIAFFSFQQFIASFIFIMGTSAYVIATNEFPHIAVPLIHWLTPIQICAILTAIKFKRVRKYFVLLAIFIGIAIIFIPNVPVTSILIPEIPISSNL